jgi:hypothetical protein
VAGCLRPTTPVLYEDRCLFAANIQASRGFDFARNHRSLVESACVVKRIGARKGVAKPLTGRRSGDSFARPARGRWNSWYEPFDTGAAGAARRMIVHVGPAVERLCKGWTAPVITSATPAPLADCREDHAGQQTHLGRAHRAPARTRNDGVVIALRSNVRWCSDHLEFTRTQALNFCSQGELLCLSA